MSRAIIITSYLEHPLDLKDLLQPDDYIVCLDGGYDIARRHNVHPNLVLGDFDSIRTQKQVMPAEHPGLQVLRYPPEKDYTDLELALRILDPAETPDLLIIGGLGGRLDQTVINLQMLQRYTAPQGADFVPSSLQMKSADAPAEPDYGSFRQYRRIELMDGHNRCFVIYGDELPDGDDAPDGAPNAGPAGTPAEIPADGLRKHTIPGAPNSYLSLLSLSEECSGVSLQGVKYPLDNTIIRRGHSLSASNEFRAKEAVLTVRRGCLLVVIARGNENDSVTI